MTNTTITGRLIADAQTKSTPSGHQLAEFTVSVITEFKKDASGYYPSQLYKVAAFGKLGEFRLPMLNKGVNVLVIGEPKYRVYEGKLYIDMRASEIEILERAEAKAKAPEQHPETPEINVDDLDVEMPF